MVALTFSVQCSLIERTTDQVAVLLASKIARHFPGHIGLVMASKTVIEDSVREFDCVGAGTFFILPHIVNKNGQYIFFSRG